MASNRKRTQAARAHQAEHPGTSFTQALFAVREQPAAEPTPAQADPAPAAPAQDPAELIGRLVLATAPGRRPRRGVILPPAERARTTRLRLTRDGKPPVAFDPAEWTITIEAGHDTSCGLPIYTSPTLPAEHLATKTMLRTEQRRAPGTRQPAIAVWDNRLRGRQARTAPLYAAADAQALPELSPQRAAAWATARTCARCATTAARPFQQVRDGNRYCHDCLDPAFDEYWAAQRAQIRRAESHWARQVLADPTTVIAAPAGLLKDSTHVYAEAFDGTVLLDAMVNTTAAWSGRAGREVHGAVWADTLLPVAEQLAACRITSWYGYRLDTLGSLLRATRPDLGEALKREPVGSGEAVCEHVREWAGMAESRSWYNTRARSQYPPNHPDPGSRDAHVQEVADVRRLLQLMAHWPDPAREPNVDELLRH